MRFDGTDWVNDTGCIAFSDGVVGRISLAIDNSNKIYVAYQDMANDGNITVKKYNGADSWDTIGNAGFSNGTADYVSIEFDKDNTPYVSYKDSSLKITVMKYNSIKAVWEDVGSASFSTGEVYYPFLAIDNSGTPYVAYEDAANASKATVMRYNSLTNSWDAVGSVGFSANSVNYSDIKINNAGIPYVAYRDANNSNKATVMKYDGSSWVAVGNTGFSAGEVNYTTIGIDQNGTSYIVYKDAYYGNKATVMTTLGTGYIDVEQFENNTSVTTITAIDVDGDAITYSISGGDDSALFSIGNSSGILTFNSAPNFEDPQDFNSDNIYEVYITVSAGGESDTKIVKVRILDADDAPVLITPDNIVADEDSLVSVVELNASDEDNDSITYSASIDDTSLASVSITDSNLTIVLAQNANGTAQIEVNATANGLIDTKTFTLTVNPIDDPLTFEPLSNINKDEDFYPFNVDLNSSDIDGDTITYTYDINDTSLATLGINGNTLLISSVANANGVAQIDINATAAGVTVARSFILTVSPVEDPPILQSISDVVKNEDDIAFDINLSASDAEGDPITYSASIGDNSMATVSVTGNILTITPKLNAYGSVQITVEANASNGTGFDEIDTKSFTLMLNEIDDPPVLDAISNVIKKEDDNLFVINLNATDVDNDTITYSAITDNDSLVVLSVNENQLSIKPVFDASGVANITAKATARGVTVEQSFQVTINPTSNAPIIVNTASDMNWSNLGTAGFSQGTVFDTSIAVHDSQIPYVVYKDTNNSNKATVMKYDGNNSWITVGNAGFSAGGVQGTSIVIDSSGTPYVVYVDINNSYKATVMKYYDGNNSWEPLGNAGFSAGKVDYISLAIHNTTPYVAYKDVLNDNKITVMKYYDSNNSWETVGNAGFSAGSVDYTSIAIANDGTPYVVYKDGVNSSKATVMKFDGVSWVVVGNAGISAGSANFTDIDIDSHGAVYIVYQDISNNYKVSVQKFDGDIWYYLGSEGLSAGDVSETSISIDNRDIVYIIYKNDINNKTTAMMFDGNNWQEIGNDTISEGATDTNSIAIDGNATLYVAYKDGANSDKISVVTTLKTGSVDINHPENNMSITTINAVDIDGDSILYSKDGGIDSKYFFIDSITGVLKFDSVFPDYEKPLDANGDNTYEVIIKATDSTGRYDTKLVKVKVVNIDEPPVLTKPADLVISDEETIIILDATDVDGDTIVYSADINDTSLMKIDLNGSRLTLIPQKNAKGVVRVDINATANGLADEKSFIVSLLSDIPPQINTNLSDKTIYEDSESIVIDLNATDMDSNESNIIFTAQSSNESIAFAFIKDNKLIIIPQKNAYGVVDIEVNATVDGKTDTKRFEFNLLSVNDSPTIELVRDINYIQDADNNITDSIDLAIWDDDNITTLSAISSNSELIKNSDLNIIKTSNTTATVSYLIESSKTGITTIVLTATDSDGLIYNEEFRVIVEPADDAKCVQTIKDKLSFDDFKGLNSKQEYITSNLDLITSMTYVCSADISWNSSDITVIENNGTVIPGNNSNTVALTATITKGDFNASKGFFVTVAQAGLDDQNSVNEAAKLLIFESIKNSNLRSDQIISNLNLPTSGAFDTNISWNSTDEVLLDSSNGQIIRHSVDTNVTLTATLTKGGASTTKVFNVTILALAVSQEEQAIQDRKWLNLDKILGDNKDDRNIVVDLAENLPTVGPNGSSITWKSSNLDVMTNSGEITRDNLEDKFVEFEATIENGTYRLTKSFNLKVLKAALDDTTLQNITFESFINPNEAIGEDKLIGMVLLSDGKEVNTTLNVDKSIKQKLETFIKEDIVKNIFEFVENVLTVYLNTDGSTQIKSEATDDNNTMSQINFDVVGAKTNIDENGTVSVDYDIDTNVKIDAKLDTQGAVEHNMTLSDIGKTTQTISRLNGSRIKVTDNGTTTTYTQGYRSNDEPMVVEAISNTDNNGKTKTWFVKRNLKTAKTSYVGNTIKGDTLLEPGSKVEIYKQQDVIFMKITTDIPTSLTIE